MIVRD